MSSNIEIQRICQHCGAEFTAKTTVTQYCSNSCAKKAYKIRKRNEKIENSNIDTKKIRNKPVEDLSQKEFLTVTQTSLLIGCSRQNVYKLINSGKLKATNILEKKTIIKRSEIDALFDKSQVVPKKEIHEYDIEECYNLTEISNIFSISNSAIYEIIKRNNLPKIKKGRFIYVPKIMIDKIFNS